MNLKILIVEDQVLLADEIKFALEEVGYSVVQAVDNGNEALQIVKESEVDIVLMDIGLKGEMDGIETAKKIQEYQDIPIIYLTELPGKKTWAKARETGPVAYLKKPFDVDEVYPAMEIALNNTSEVTEENISKEQDIPLVINDRVYFKDDKSKRYIRILADEILYIEAAGSYSHIYTTIQKFLPSQNLNQLSLRLPFEQLVRVHRSYIVNIDKITEFEGNRIYIEGKEIPLGETYRDEFKKRFLLI